MTTTQTPTQTALQRMRDCAAKAHTDTTTLTGPLADQARTRTRLFAEAAADLAGTTLERELARAAGTPDEPAWQLS